MVKWKKGKYKQPLKKTFEFRKRMHLSLLPRKQVIFDDSLLTGLAKDVFANLGVLIVKLDNDGAY